MVNKDDFFSENVRQAEKVGVEVAMVQAIVDYFLGVLTESDHAGFALKTTQRTWGQLFHLPNPFPVPQKKLNLEYEVHTSYTYEVLLKGMVQSFPRFTNQHRHPRVTGVT